MKKRILSAICVFFLGVSFMACANDGQTDSASRGNETAAGDTTEITFVLDWTPNTNHTGVYVADAMGYFEEEGISVSIVQPPDDGAEMLVASGKAQFGVSFQDYIMPAVAGDDPMPIAAVAAILQHNTSGIISLKEKGIEAPKDMAGHTYATWDLDLEKATLKQVIEKDGGDFGQVELVPSTVTDEPSALASDMVDCIWVYYGWAGVACEQAGLDVNYFSFEEIDPVFDYYTPVMIGNTDWMEENPEVAKAFLRAVKKGYEYSIENPDKASDLLIEAVPELDEELVRASMDYMAPRYIDDAEKWGIIDADRWNAFFNWINDNDLGPAKIPENTGFTNEYLP